MAPDAGKFESAPVANDAVSESTLDLSSAAVKLGGEAFDLPGSSAEQSDALMAVNTMGATDTGFDFADAGMGAATELIPDTGDIANTGKLEFGGKENEATADAAKKGDAGGEAATSDGAQEKNMMGNAAFLAHDMGKGFSEEAKQAADNFIFNGDNWFDQSNKKTV